MTNYYFIQSCFNTYFLKDIKGNVVCQCNSYHEASRKRMELSGIQLSV